MEIEVTRAVRTRDEIDKGAGDFYILDLILDGCEEQVAFPASRVKSRQDLIELLGPWAAGMLKDRPVQRRMPGLEGTVEIEAEKLTT